MTLSNVGSYTNWSADFDNSRCSRTVNNSYNATLNSTRGCWQYAKGSNIGSWVINDSWQCRDSLYGGCWSNMDGTVSIGTLTSINGNSICALYSKNYTCPSGGTLSGSTCSKIDTEYKSFSTF